MPHASSQAMERLEFPLLLNARDLGGHTAAGGRRTKWRAFVRSDELARLSPEGEQALRAYGVRTIVDLRWPAERRERPSVFESHPGEVAYHHVSLLAENEPAWKARAPEVPKEMWNRQVLEYARGELARVLRVIAAAAPGTVLFHCMAGKDRTGLIASLLLDLAGVDAESIARDYTLSADNLMGYYLSIRPATEQAQVLEGVRCPKEQVYGTLAYLERRGGTAAYLSEIGLAESEISRLRERLV